MLVVYVSDHQAPDGLERVDPEVAALCQGADLLIHDAQYTDEEFMTLPTGATRPVGTPCTSQGPQASAGCICSTTTRPTPTG